MGSSQSSWGIEVGANALKAIKLEQTADGVVLVEHEILPFKQVLTTPDMNVNEAIQVNLDMFVSKHNLKGSKIVVSVPGHTAFARFAKMPPVEPKRIPDIVRFEAVQQIPFPIEQVEWDYQVFQQEDSPEVEVGIFAITKERVMNFLANYAKVDFEIDALTLSPLAVFNAFQYEAQLTGDTASQVYLDIGSQSTDVIIVDNGAIWLRTLPIGGNNFTEALVRSFKLSFSKAEKLKREAGTSKYARQVFQAMRPVFADLVQELQRSLGYYQSLNRDAELKKVTGIGSTFRLPGLRKFLQQQLQMEVVRAEGYKNIQIEDKLESEFADIALNMTSAYGCALQGLGLESVGCNLMPQHILVKRQWAAKRKWFVAAAGSMAAAAAIAVGTTMYEKQSFSSEYEQVQREMRPLVSQAQEQQGRLTNIDNPQNRIENFQRLLDYRDLWPKVMTDVVSAIGTIQSQRDLLEADYQRVAQIPRQERRRIYVDDLTVTYVPRRTGQTRTGGDGFGGGQQMDMSEGVQSLTLDRFFPSRGGDDTGDGLSSAVQPPCFEVVMTGTTPMSQALAARVLSDTVISWLKDNADRADRPYRIVVQDDNLLEVRPVQVTTTDQRTQPQPTRGRGGIAATVGAAQPRTDARAGQIQLDEITFQHPLADEDVSRDTFFIVRWQIELKRPGTARRAESTAEATPQRSNEQSADRPTTQEGRS